MLLRLVLAIAFIAYPLMVLFAPAAVPRPALIGLFGALAAGRVLLAKALSRSTRAIALVAIALFCLLAIAGPELTVLKIYPVLLSVLGAGYGLYTLKYPPSAIERLARATGMHIDQTGARYTRGVTKLWVVFFVCNGLIAAYTAVLSSTTVWSLYNGVLSYCLIAVLFALEYWYRGHYRRRHEASP